MKKYTFLFFSILSILSSKSQEAIKFATPEVSSLIKYIDNPVSYDRGMVDISIPLYEIDVSGVKIPITLSYYHKGLKPNEGSNWLGFGWSLKAEPVIARTINGRDDLNTTYTSADDISITRNNDYYVDLAENLKDEDPDQYYYTLPSKSGSFFFMRNNSTGVFDVKTIPYEPIKIKYSSDQFEVIDDNGTCYYFGKAESNEKYQEIADNKIIAWKCTKIIAPNKKDFISFNYYPIENEKRRNITDFLSIEDNLSGDSKRDFIGRGKTSQGTVIQSNAGDAKCGWSVPIIKYNKDGYTQSECPFYLEPIQIGVGTEWKILKICQSNYTDPAFEQQNSYRRIQSITFKNGIINFIRLDNCLSLIEIRDNNNQIVKKVLLEQERIGGTYNYPLLKAVEFVDGNNNRLEKYTIEYNGLPNTNYTSAINFWGYYTGSGDGYYFGSAIQRIRLPILIRKDSNTSLFNNYFDVGSIHRESPASQNGILKSISTSLGGKTEFIYESDSYFKDSWTESTPYEPSPIIKAGGLRIKEIKKNDPITNTTLTRVFKYGKLNVNGIEDGLGIIRNPITPEQYMKVQTRKVLNNNIADYSGTSRIRTLSSWLFGDMTMSGAPVVYDRVTEYNVSEQNGITIDNGKTVYIFDHTPMGTNIVPGTNLNLDNKLDWSRGQLKTKQIYKRIGNRYDLIQKIDYSYTTFFKDKIKVGKAYLHTIADGDNTTAIRNAKKEGVRYYTYYIETGAVKINAEIDSVFTDNGIVATKKEYIYSNGTHLYPTSIKTTNSDGAIKSQSMSYPLDNGSLQTTEHLQAKNSLVSNWIVSPILETKETVNSESLTTYSSYKIFSNLQVPSFYQTITKKNDNPTETRFTCYNYDQYGNPVYISKDDTENIVYLWSYQGKYPIAEIRNATYSQINSIIGIESLSARSEPYQSDWNAINDLRTNLSLGDILITTYTYKPLVGIISMTDPRGLTTYYKYDTFGRLKEIYFIENNIKKMIKKFGYHYQDQ